MGTALNRNERVAQESARSVQVSQQSGGSATSTFHELAVAIVFAVVGWGLCGAVIWIGSRFATMNTVLVIHAAAVPVIFGSLSLLYFKKFAAASPLQTAVVFLAVVIALDLFVVSLLIEKNFDMFRSIIGTWVPFALIFISSYMCGVFATKGLSAGSSKMPADPIRPPHDRSARPPSRDGKSNF